MPAQKRQRNPRGGGAQLKVEIIEAAMRLLDQQPAARLSLRTVAKEAGITPPSIYAHFSDASVLTTEIVRECWSQMALAMQQAMESKHSVEGFDGLSVKMAAFVRYAMERPSRYQLLFALHPIDTKETQVLPGLLQPAFRNVVKSLEQIVADGGKLPTKDPRSSALLTLSLAHGRIALAHLSPQLSGNSAQNVEAFVLETLQQIFFPEL